MATLSPSASNTRPITAAPNDGWSTYASPLNSTTSISVHPRSSASFTLVGSHSRKSLRSLGACGFSCSGLGCEEAMWGRAPFSLSSLRSSLAAVLAFLGVLTPSSLWSWLPPRLFAALSVFAMVCALGCVWWGRVVWWGLPFLGWGRLVIVGGSLASCGLRKPAPNVCLALPICLPVLLRHSWRLCPTCKSAGA